MEERIDWHNILQEILENISNLQLLSGKIIAGKAREYHQMIRADFICHTQGDLSNDKLKPIIRPFSHFKKRNIVEYKSSWEVVNEKTFRRYIARTLDAETCDDVDYQGETTLTIFTTRKPESLIANKRYKIERISEWKYRSYWIDDLDVFILVHREMKGIQGGEALALLQALEDDKTKQKACWHSLLEQDLDNKDVIRKIIEKINKEAFMSLVEELKIERSQEIAIEMLKDGMEISQIMRFTKLPREEVLKLKKKFEQEQ